MRRNVDVRKIWKSIKDAFGRLWNWLCTSRALRAVLLVAGVTVVGGCGLVLLKRRSIGKRTDTGRRIGGTGAGSGNGIDVGGSGSLSGALRDISDSINAIQAGLDSDIREQAGGIRDQIGELDGGLRELERGLSELDVKP